jgi:hypothetical protein
MLNFSRMGRRTFPYDWRLQRAELIPIESVSCGKALSPTLHVGCSSTLNAEYIPPLPSALQGSMPDPGHGGSQGADSLASIRRSSMKKCQINHVQPAQNSMDDGPQDRVVHRI